MGRVYQQKGSANWWVQYSARGRVVRESSGSTNRTDAVRLLKQQIGKIAMGQPVGPQVERTTFEDLARVIENEYLANERASLKRLRHSLAHLRRFFGGDRALTITSDRVTKYTAERREQGAKNATINRELAALRRMFRLAEIAGKVASRPHIAMLAEHNARQGFLDHGAFLALRDALPDYLKDPIGFLYFSGWRRGEMVAVEWRDVEETAIRLRPELSKNKQGRVLPLSGELLDIIERARERRRLDCPYVFHRDGNQIIDFRFAWNKALAKVGLGKVLVHDLRRCAVRNLSRSGVSERVAMTITGHKTRSVFDRYDIISEADLQHAVAKVGSYLEDQPTVAKVVPISRAN